MKIPPSPFLPRLISPEGVDVSGKVRDRSLREALASRRRGQDTDVSGRFYDQSLRDIGMGVISGDASRVAWVPKKAGYNQSSSAIHVADNRSGELTQRIWTPDKHWIVGDFSADASRIAVGSAEGMVLVFDIETKRLLFSHQDTAGSVKCVAISPDGKTVAAAFEHGSIKWWPVGEANDQVQFPEQLPNALFVDRSVREMFDVFATSIRESDDDKLEVIRRWQASSQRSEPLSQFLALALRSTDSEIRRTAITLFGRNSRQQKVSLSPEMMRQLLAVVEDANEAKNVRREAIWTILLDYEHDRKRLYEQLSILGEEGHFSIQTLSEFINAREQRHWAVGGAFDAPIGAVELLESWSADAADAVPALTIALESQPNRWDFTPAIARTLAAIGPKASTALPALRRVEDSTFGKLRLEVNRAIQAIESKSPEQ